MKNIKVLAATILLGMGIMVSGCGHNADTPHLVQLDNGRYTMSTGDDYGINYLKGYSDDQVTNYKMIRVIGKDVVNIATVDDVTKYIETHRLLALANIQYIGDAVEYNDEIYQAVNASSHVYEGQKLIINADHKDNQKITIDGEFKQYALGKVTKVERDESGHLTHYTIKVVKGLELVRTNNVDHLEISK